ncbi:hypothetical protein TNCV_2122071 [Trichonephila clavipes]|nr:hypothetical protein TNCV_2122071 [Trichonephila clavipes]
MMPKVYRAQLSICALRNWTKNYGALVKTARVCIWVLRTNRTKGGERDWWPNNEKERGACCGLDPGV